MDHDYTLEELIVMLRVTTRGLGCTSNGVPHDWCKAHDSCVKCKLDIIDAIERKAAEEWQRGYDEGFASADDWCAEHEDEMAEHGWYRALDADSKVIKANDELFSDDGELCGRVTAIGVGERNHFVWVLKENRNVSVGLNKRILHHHHPPTVEDVLREFALKVAGKECMTMRQGVVEEYAKRLRLADKED